VSKAFGQVGLQVSRGTLRRPLVGIGVAVILIGLALFSDMPAYAHSPAQVDQHRALHAVDDPNNWMLYGATFGGERYSSLNSIDVSNVKRLGVAWSRDIEAPDGLSSTPLVVDGVIYLAAPFSVVYAMDAASGRELWRYQPQINYPATNAISVTIAARVSRGVAVWNGKVYVAVADCRLVALEASTGKPVWEISTCDIARGYSLDAAPTVGNGMVIVGNGIGENGLKNRGYVTAYDAETGRQLWRFFNAPSDSPEENTSRAMRLAASTWNGTAWQAYGGGASAWDFISYDPKLDQVYFGTAEARPYAAAERSPNGGDNLFTSSVIALRASTGEYVWHYQTNPRDDAGFDDCTNIILSHLTIGGKAQDVLMIAPKNGFFYVLNRQTGKLLSAKPFSHVTWATAVDEKTGRPILNSAADLTSPGHAKSFDRYPIGWGAHNWHPMSFNPLLKLVYIPVTNIGSREVVNDNGSVSDLGDGSAMDGPPGKLVAWDPILQQERWSYPIDRPFSGGTLTTGGNLVFHGATTGEFRAFSADRGALLWALQTGSPIAAAPVTYAVDGKQYVLVGLGGGSHARYEDSRQFFSDKALGPTRIVAFALDGTLKLPQERLAPTVMPKPPALTADAATLARGEHLYHDHWCFICHGAGAQ
jgi:quinohemoprotein ethanol dehydrogenase